MNNKSFQNDSKKMNNNVSNTVSSDNIEAKIDELIFDDLKIVDDNNDSDVETLDFPENNDVGNNNKSVPSSNKEEKSLSDKEHMENQQPDDMNGDTNQAESDDLREDDQDQYKNVSNDDSLNDTNNVTQDDNSKKDDNDQNQSDQVNNSKEEDRNERIEEPQKNTNNNSNTNTDNNPNTNNNSNTSNNTNNNPANTSNTNNSNYKNNQSDSRKSNNNANKKNRNQKNEKVDRKNKSGRKKPKNNLDNSKNHNPNHNKGFRGLKRKRNSVPKKASKNDAGKSLKAAGKKIASILKKIISFVITHPIIALILFLIIFIIVFLIIFIVPAFAGTITPGRGSDYKIENNFSEKDKKTLEDLNKKITEANNPTNAELAMFAVAYPYYESLQDGTIDPYITKEIELSEEEKSKFQEWIDEKKIEILESFGCDDMCRELLGDAGIKRIVKEYAKEYIKNKIVGWLRNDDDDDDEDVVTSFVEDEDDPYLKLFRKGKYKSRFKKLLGKLNASAEEGDYSLETQKEFYDYLKNDYFKSDAGYKSLFLESKDEEKLKDAIITDISNNAGQFSVYIGDNCTTSNSSLTALNSSGNINSEIKGDIYIRLRDYRDDGKGNWISSDHFKSPILYGTDVEPLSFARYVMGVAYAEVGGDKLKNETNAKTIMVTAKSYTLGRYKSMGQNYPKPEFDSSNNRTIIEMRGNVGDQDFCDVYEGCKSGKYSWSTRTVNRGSGDPKPALNSSDLANLEKWWNDISDVYVVNSDGNFSGNQYETYNSSCIRGKCVSQEVVANASKREKDYMNVLFNSNNGGFDNKLYEVYNVGTGGTYAVSTGSKFCSTKETGATRQQIVDFAISMVGKIPYYYYEGQSDGYGALGHAISKEFNENHFNENTKGSVDHKGRNKYGLDCSGFVDFVYWNVLDNNLGNGNTDTLKSLSTEITHDELQPGDLGFLNNDSSGTGQHVGIYIGNDEWVELNPSGVKKGPYPDFKVYYRLKILNDIDATETKNSDSKGTSTGKLQSPIEGKKPVCDDYPNYKKGKYHGGTDITVTVGTDVKAMDGGTVITSKDITSGDCSHGRNCNGGYYSYGRYIEIKHSNGIITKYAHLSKRLVKVGDKVSSGQVIGKSGDTGNSTGPHLHIEVIVNNKNKSPCDYVK